MAKSSQAGHVDLTKGADVQYAGEMKFSKGQLQYWNNGSGHYQPSASTAGNFVDVLKQNGITDVSMDNFVPIK